MRLEIGMKSGLTRTEHYLYVIIYNRLEKEIILEVDFKDREEEPIMNADGTWTYNMIIK